MSTVIEKPFEQQTADEQAQTIAAQQAAEPAKETPNKLTFTASDGRVYEAETPEELFSKMDKDRSAAITAMKDRERQIFDLRQQVKQPPKTGEYNHEQFLKTVETNGTQAIDYAIEHGKTGQELAELKAYVAEQKQKETYAQEMQRFYAETQYGKIQNEDNNALIRVRMEEKNRPITADALKLTYLELKEEGKFDIKEPAKTRKAPPPSASGGGSVAPSEEIDMAAFERMSAKEQLEVLRKQGVDVSGIR